MRSYQGRKCLCCKNCSKCQEFRKVISDNGFDIYIYVRHSKAITKGKDLIGNNGFVFNNMHNIAINKDDILQKIESSEFNCERCKSVLIQVSKILKDPIQENKVIVICASCISRCMSSGLQRCKFCHRIYDKFISSKKLQGVTIQDYANKWSSEIRHLLEEESQEQVDNKLIPSDIESQHIEAILSDLPRMTTEKDAGVEQAEIGKKVMDEESQGIKTVETHLPQITTEDVDVDTNKLHLELKNVTQDIKHLTLISQQSYGEKYGSEEITEIFQKAKSQEAFDYIFPKIDFKQVSLGKHISSRELLKEMEEKVDKHKSYSAAKKIKSEAINETKLKIKKQTSTHKHVHIDEEHGIFPSNRESKTLNERPKRKNKSEKEIDGSEKLEYEVVDIHVGNKEEPERKNKKKEKYKVADGGIDDRDVLNIKVKRKEKYKKDDADIGENDALDSKLKRKGKYKIADINADDSEVPEKKRKDKGHKDLGIKKKEKDRRVFEQIRSTEGSGDGFDFSKIMSKKKIKEEDENLLSIQKKKIKKGSRLGVSDSMQFSSKNDKSRGNILKESDVGSKSKQSELQKIDKSEKGRKEKKSDLVKTKSAAPDDLKLSQVKIRNTSIEDFHIDMVKIRQSAFTREKAKKPTQPSDQLTPVIEQKSSKISLSAVFEESESINEKKIEELLQKVKLKENNEIIIGKKIVRHSKRYLDKIAKKMVQPMLFESTFKQQMDTEKMVEEESYQPEKIASSVLYRKSKSLHKFTDQDTAKGGIHYKLSNRSFIDKGWTMLPTEKIVRKMNIYRMRPSHPEFDWFEHNKDKRLMHYDTGEPLAQIEEDGRGQWFYRNGRLALDYYNAEEVNAGQRYVVYSNGEPDEKGRPRPITVLATFDYLGNGIVFDHAGKVRLKYNQTEGAVLDKDIGPVSHWKWHELNDPPILQKVMIDTQMAIKDPEIFKMGGTGENVPRADNEEMLAIEFDNFIKEKSKKLTQKFKPFQIKMKALKINENFSLRVLDQATVYLLFRDGSTNLKLNLGMILDHKQIVDTDTAEVGEVTCNLERLPARTDSLAMLQRSVARAQHVEKLRLERECRFRLSEVKPSIDRLTAAVSRPLKVPLLTELEIECMCTKK